MKTKRGKKPGGSERSAISRTCVKVRPLNEREIQARPSMEFVLQSKFKVGQTGKKKDKKNRKKLSGARGKRGEWGVRCDQNAWASEQEEPG